MNITSARIRRTASLHAVVLTIAISLVLGGCAPTLGQIDEPDARFEVPDSEGEHWYRGNTHTHTLESDGDSPPAEVATWYREHDYNFLVLSDHNVWVDPSELDHLVDSTFILIPGEEITSGFEGKPVHVNGLDIPHVIEPRTDSTLVGTIQKNVDAVRDVEGVPHVNHPNFGWAFDHEVLEQVRDDRLLEIYNGHPHVHNVGGGGSPGLEEIWDHLLTGGKRIYGIAVDDAHHFQGEFSKDRANPGRGWVVVRANRLEAGEILGRMEAGQFYATTGVELEDLVITPTRFEIHIAEEGNFKYATEFLGDGGTVLHETSSNPAEYTLSGTESYVRARITDSGGKIAWIQPVFVTRR